MTHPLVAWIVGAAAIVTALSVLWRLVVRGILSRFAGLKDFLDDVRGEQARPGVAARPGIMDRLASLDSTLTDHCARLTAIEHELYPNSGASLRDAVDRIERATDTG